MAATPQQSQIRANWSYYGCDNDAEATVAEQWQARRTAIEGKVGELSDAAGQLNVVVELSNTSPTWNMDAALQMPGTALVAEGSGDRCEEAFETMLSQLSEKIDRRKEQPVEVRQRREGLQGLQSLLESWHQKGRSKDFLALLMPVAASISPYIYRELQVREIEGETGNSRVSPYDVLDEVLLRAWEAFPSRDREHPIDRWLLDLSDGAIDRLTASVASESLDSSVAAPAPEPDDSRRHEWVEQVSYFEQTAVGQLMPGDRGVDSWDQADLELGQRRVAGLLSGLPREQRRAVVMNLVLGFTPGEIADFQNRSVVDVEADLEEGSKRVRENATPQEEQTGAADQDAPTAAGSEARRH